jgi:hypothetical protein
MNTELGINGKGRIHCDSHATSLNALIVYDEVRAGKRAKELCDRLRKQLAPESGLNLRVWSLSALQLPTFAQTAARQAEGASVLIVAVHGNSALSRSVQSCLHTCAHGIHSADGALVAQLHGVLEKKEELCRAYACLRQIAHHVGVRFFSEVVELPEAERDETGVGYGMSVSGFSLPV